MSIRYTPVFTSGAWHNLYIIRIHNYIMIAQTFIDKPFSMIQNKVHEFQSILVQSGLELPLEVYSDIKI